MIVFSFSSPISGFNPSDNTALFSVLPILGRFFCSKYSPFRKDQNRKFDYNHRKLQRWNLSNPFHSLLWSRNEWQQWCTIKTPWLTWGSFRGSPFFLFFHRSIQQGVGTACTQTFLMWTLQAWHVMFAEMI